MTKDRLVALDNGDLPTPDEAREYVALLRWREAFPHLKPVFNQKTGQYEKRLACPQEK